MAEFSHMVLVKHIARRKGSEILEDISREVIGPIPGDPEEPYNRLARYLASTELPELEKKLREVKRVKNCSA